MEESTMEEYVEPRENATGQPAGGSPEAAGEELTEEPVENAPEEKTEDPVVLPPLSRLDQLAVNAYIRSINAGNRTIDEVLPRLKPYVIAQMEASNANG